MSLQTSSKSTYQLHFIMVIMCSNGKGKNMFDTIDWLKRLILDKKIKLNTKRLLKETLKNVSRPKLSVLLSVKTDSLLESLRRSLFGKDFNLGL